MLADTLLSSYIYYNLGMSNLVLAATLAAKEVYLYQHGARKRARARRRAYLPYFPRSPAVLEGKPPDPVQLDETGSALTQDWQKEGVLERRVSPMD